MVEIINLTLGLFTLITVLWLAKIIYAFSEEKENDYEFEPHKREAEKSEWGKIEADLPPAVEGPVKKRRRTADELAIEQDHLRTRGKK